MIEAEIYGHKFMSNFASDWMMTGRPGSLPLPTIGNHMKCIFWIHLRSASSKCWLRLVASPSLSLMSSGTEAVQVVVDSVASTLSVCSGTCWRNKPVTLCSFSKSLCDSYHVFTCVSDKLSWLATSPRSATDKYFWHRNFRSRKASCEWVNAVLLRRFLFKGPLLPSSDGKCWVSGCGCCMFE